MSVTLNHTGITVGDLDRSIALFSDLFEFELVSRAPRDPDLISRVIGVPGARVEIAYMRNASGGTVELLAYSGPDERQAFAPRACDLGSLHLGFNVDIDAALAKASKHGLEPMGEVIVIDAGPNQGARIAYLRNPEGLVLELIQAP
ncbi:VOC family protein [Rhizobium sp. ARZ01]|uniref:VOC family protein n=1 Tax=Rhizobium sp. ARZ01 TaxID=2769313 RepID=UPI00177F4A82|nr:VOC family protein [Rhizobium sp. ARZ01]MBD9375707.1 VOC family protein [Rhizobium sp. ARZ01]